MFTFDIKAIRNEYEKLSTLVEKVNNTASEKDLVTRAKSISNEDIWQIYSEQHGGVIDAIMKNTDNAAFIVLLDGAKGKLVLSPYINIKTPNGVVVIVWNIKYDIMTFLPLLKWVTKHPLIKILWQKILYEKILIKFYSLHTMGTRDKPHIDIYTIPTQWG